MASTYVNDLRLNEMATGDASGSWGTNTNTNLSLIGEALGFGTEGITTNADTHTSTVADGATDPVRAMYVKYTGTLDSACTITIAPNTINRMQFIENGTSGSQNIIISQGSGANVTIPPGDVKAVYLDGAGSGAAVTDAFASLNVVDLKVQDDLTVTDDATIGGTLGVTGVLTTTAATVFNGGFASNAASTITTADNLDTLSLVSTDADANVGPNLLLYRNSGSPANNDALGSLSFTGRNDNSQDVEYALVRGFIDDVTDGTEDGILIFSGMSNGSVIEQLRLSYQETVFNEGSVDVDFRVEGNGNANMLFVDAGNDRVGIGTDSPTHRLLVKSDANSNPAIVVQQTSNTDGWGIIPDSTNGNLEFTRIGGGTTGSHLTVTNAARVGIGTTSPAETLDVSGNALLSGSDGTLRKLTFGATSGNHASVGVDASGHAFINAEASGANTKFLAAGSSVTEITSGGAVRATGGAVSAPTYSFNNDTDTGMSRPTTNSLNFVTAGAERMRLNASGLIGMGNTPSNLTTEILTITTPSSGGGQGLALKRLDTNSDQSVGQIRFSNNSTDDLAFIKVKTDGANTAGCMQFFTNVGDGSTEKMRINKLGQVMFGVTSSIAASTIYGINDSSDSFCRTQNNSTGSTNPFAIFHANGEAVIGSINCTNSATVYNTSSDYRLKENVRPIENGLDRLNNLNPVKFEWKEDGTTSEGFIAHEAQAVFPDAITGEKDGEDIQGMDYGRITPLLVKAIQEQQTTIENLTARLNTLEG